MQDNSEIHHVSYYYCFTFLVYADINPEMFFRLEIWRVDWGEIETREESDLDLPWVSRIKSAIV